MTPRSQIEALDLDAARRTISGASSPARNHTRLPVYRGSLDNIVGVLHARKVLNMGAEDITAESLAEVMRPPYFVPDGHARCSRSCRTSRRKRNAWAWWWTSTAS